MPVNHEKAIAHMNKQINRFGVVSFGEINKVAGGNVISRNRFFGFNKTVVAAREKNLVLVELPRGRSLSGGGKGTKLATAGHLVKAELVPFLGFAAETTHGLGKNHPVVNILFKIEEQGIEDNKVILDGSSKGVKILCDKGLLKKTRFEWGKKPKGIDNNQLPFEIKNSGLLKQVIKAVKRVIALQKERFS